MTVRIGLVAASRIAKLAVIEPAPLVDGVELSAVAARDAGRARQLAERCGAAHAYGSYRELLDADTVDAVYIGTPAAHHREWAVAAIEAGKHVLCEKPLASNADDAARIADAAAGSSVVVMEAFHWRYHPYAAQIRAVLDSGVLGEVRGVEGIFDIPVGKIARDDIRWNLALGGGATMDLGCYSIQWARFAAETDPTVLPEVVSASAECPVPGVDASLGAELRWPSGVTGWVHSSMISPAPEVIARLTVTGTDGTMVAENPLAPQNGGSVITVDAAGGSQRIEADTSTTYFHQMIAFRDAITDSAPFPTTAEDGVRNMQVIDACYQAAGLDPRPTA